MAEPARGRTTRTTLALLVLLAALVAVGAVGVRLLFAEVPAKGPDPVTVSCWDGEQRTNPNACGRPTGVPGLRWVFPSFRPGDEGCRDVLDDHPEFQGPTMWACDVEIAGSPVLITYSELTEVEESLAYLERSYADVDRTTVKTTGGRPVRYEWRRPFEDGYVLISVYAEHPYAVEVRAEDEVVREDALATVVKFRAPSAMRYR
ncbi:MAG: hypothetical protein Q7J48_20700 [Nocardioides sp.]|nr:hypothetical protein [Nocardioides sp.]